MSIKKDGRNPGNTWFSINYKGGITMKTVMIVVISVILLFAVFANADDMISKLSDNNTNYESIGRDYLLPDDWCCPTGGGPYEGFAISAAYTEEWPSLNCSVANFMDLENHYGVTYTAGIDEFEVGVMDDSDFSCLIDFYILGDAYGYPDGSSGSDALFALTGVDTSGWVSGTYPDVAWNLVTIPDPWEPIPDKFYFGMHTYWSDGGADFYIGFQSEENGALPVAWIFMDVWHTPQDYGYEPGAFAFKIHVFEVSAIQETSLGSIKAMF